jgi:hypothetical protein
VVVVTFAPSDTDDGAIAVSEPVIDADCVPELDPICSVPVFLKSAFDPIVTLPVLDARAILWVVAAVSMALTLTPPATVIDPV